MSDGAKTMNPAKKIDASEKPATPAVNGASTNGDKTDSTGTHDDSSRNDHSRETSADAKPSSPVKAKSLYLKGIPIPTTQEEVKSMFPSSEDKVSCRARREGRTERCLTRSPM